MKKIGLYVCEICSAQYKDKVECQNCEKSHVKPVQIIAQKYMSKNCYGEYPVYITVEMKDGKLITYRR